MTDYPDLTRPRKPRGIRGDMEQKMVVLKPMAWNSSGYMRPEGIEKSGKDYVALHGFGHEEWNGNPDRIWKGQRVF